MIDLGSWTDRSGLRGFWVSKEVVSVCVPGVMLLSEIALLVQPGSGPGVVASLNQVNVSGAVLATFVGLSLSYIIGQMGREVGFTVATWVTESKSRGSRVGTEAAPVPAASRGASSEECRQGDSRRPRKMIRDELPSNDDLRKMLCDKYGKEDFESFLKDYPTMARLLGADTSSGGRGSWVEGGHPVGADTNAFDYAKAWLRTEAPAFGVEQHEMSINIAASLILPTVLFPFVVYLFPGRPVGAAFSAITFSLIALPWLLRNFHSHRRWERASAIENMFVVCELRREKLLAQSVVRTAEGEGRSGQLHQMAEEGARSVQE